MIRHHHDDHGGPTRRPIVTQFFLPDLSNPLPSLQDTVVEPTPLCSMVMPANRTSAAVTGTFLVPRRCGSRGRRLFPSPRLLVRHQGPVFWILLLFEIANNVRYHPPLIPSRDLQAPELLPLTELVPRRAPEPATDATLNADQVELSRHEVPEPKPLRVRARVPSDPTSSLSTTAPRRTNVRSRGDAAISDKAVPKGRPKFVLHVGLPKTGTTFLQCALCAYANTTEPILLSDNWVFLGTCPYQSCGLEERPEQFMEHDKWDFVSRKLVVFRSFAERVKALRQQNRNVLVVFEGCADMTDDQIRALASFLHEEDWDVQVLVAYRPLYEWLPSKYNSVTKRMYRLYTWPGQPSDDDSNRPGEHWLPFDPRHGGNGNVLGTLLSEINTTQQHPAETVLHNFAAYLSVSVIPLHNLPPAPSPDVDPLLAYLFCTVLGSSPRVCEAVRANRIGNDIPSNPSDPTNYDMLATAAYEAGLLDPAAALDRGTVERRIQRRHRDVLKLTPLDFPLTCLPNQTLAEFESLSWQLERQMFPEHPYEEARQKHQQGFARKVASKSFCWIDTNKTLADPSWRSFLKSEILT